MGVLCVSRIERQCSSSNLEGFLGGSFPPFKRLDSYRHDCTPRIASKSILEDLKSQIFLEGHAPRPPLTTLYTASLPNSKSWTEPGSSVQREREHKRGQRRLLFSISLGVLFHPSKWNTVGDIVGCCTA